VTDVQHIEASKMQRASQFEKATGLRDTCDAGPNRTMFRAAAQGDTKAGRQLLEVIARAESGRTGLRWKFWSMRFNTRKSTGRIFEQHREREGLFLHPLAICSSPCSIIMMTSVKHMEAVGQGSGRRATVSKIRRTFLVLNRILQNFHRCPQSAHFRPARSPPEVASRLVSPCAAALNSFELGLHPGISETLSPSRTGTRAAFFDAMRCAERLSQSRHDLVKASNGLERLR